MSNNITLLSTTRREAQKTFLEEKRNNLQLEIYDLERQGRGEILSESVEIISSTIAIVPSTLRKKFYRVNYVTKKCQCEDHMYRGWICMHLYAVNYKLTWIDKQIPEVNTESGLIRTDLILD